MEAGIFDRSDRKRESIDAVSDAARCPYHPARLPGLCRELLPASEGPAFLNNPSRTAPETDDDQSDERCHDRRRVHGKAHAMAYASMPMFFWPAPAIPHRKVVVDVTDGAAEEARRRFGFDEASSDWRSVVARPDIDVVDICTPNNVHAEIAIAAAKAASTSSAKSPCPRTVEEARAMTEAAKAAGIIHMVAFNYRRTPAVALAKKYIEEGRIGRILNFRGTYLQDWSADENGPPSRAFRRRSRVGHGGDIGPMWWTLRIPRRSHCRGDRHDQDLCHDAPHPAGRGGQAGRVGEIAGAERAPVDVDDEVVSMLRFGNGAIGSPRPRATPGSGTTSSRWKSTGRRALSISTTNAATNCR